MIRKTALMAGIAGVMLMAAPALAQDPMSPPPATSPAMPQAPRTTPVAPSATPAMPQTMPAAPQTTPATPAPSGALQLQPGTDVKGSDGTVLGKLEGVQSNASGEQELTVRGADGQLRAVPLGGLRQEGTGVVVAWSTAEFQAAPAIAGAAARPTQPPVTPSPTPTPNDPAAPADPVTPDDESMMPDDEDTAAPPPVEPQA